MHTKRRFRDLATAVVAICLGACSALDRPAEWPIETDVGQPGGRHALLIVSGPGAPCASATIAAVSHVMSDTDHRARVFVLFKRPRGPSLDYDIDTWWNAEVVSGVQVIDDPGGVETARFDAPPESVLRYSPRGKLVSTTPLRCEDGTVAAVEDLRRAFEPDTTPGPSELVASIFSIVSPNEKR